MHRVAILPLVIASACALNGPARPTSPFPVATDDDVRAARVSQRVNPYYSQFDLSRADSAEKLYHLAVDVYEDHGDIALASRLITRALVLGKEDPWFYHDFASFLTYSGYDRRGVIAYVHSRWPGECWAYDAEARDLVALGRTAEAAEVRKRGRALASSKDATCYAHLGPA